VFRDEVSRRKKRKRDILVGTWNVRSVYRAGLLNGRIILRWTFRKWDGVVGIGWSWLRIGTGGGFL
jgi:hypothetical protein